MITELQIRKTRRFWISIAVYFAATGLLVVHALRYYPFIADDALISLRYAARFLDGLGLTWNDGERVEGYSNLLWILVVSGLGTLQIDLIVCLRILGARKLLGYLGVAILFVPYIQAQNRSPENGRAISERWEYDGEVLGTLLKNAFGEKRALITVDAAGSLGYFSRLPAIDMYGLSDYTIARRPPKNLGQGFSGHEFGDGRYVLSRKPDIAVFGTGAEFPSSPGDRQIFRTSIFRKKYERVRVEGSSPYKYRAYIWVRSDSPRIGIKRTGNSLIIPAFLLNGNTKTVAKLGSENRLGVEVGYNLPIPKRSVDLKCRTWRVTTKSENAPVKLRIESKRKVISTGEDVAFVEIRKRHRYSLTVLPKENRIAFLRSVEITRIGACMFSKKR